MNNAQKKTLKAQAHHLNPVILMGGKGLTPSVIAAIEEALTTHELIKIKLMGDQKSERLLVGQQICTATQAELVQIVGRMATIFRKNPEN